MDDTLIIGSIFDPAGLERGLKEAEQRLQRFAKNASQSVSFKSIGADVDLATADFKAGRIALEDYTYALKTAKQQFADLRAKGLEPSRAALLQIDTALGRSTGRAGEFGTATARLRSGLAQLAVTSVGASNAVGQVAQSVLLFGGGTGMVIKVAAVVLGAAFAYDKLTAATKKAKEEQEKHTAALRDAINAGQDMLAVNLAVETKRAKDLERQIARLKETAPTEGGPAGFLAERKIAKLEQELRALNITVAQGNDLFLIGEKAKQKAIQQTVEEVRIFQNAVRGSGNLTAGAGGTNTGPVTGGLLSGATADEITMSRYAASVAETEDALADFFKVATQGFSALLTVQGEAVRQQEELVQTLTDIGTGAFALADVGSALGLIGDEAARSLQDVGQLADALSEVAKSASFGNIVGAAVAGAQLLGGLFGGGPSAHDKLMAENNQRLAELKASLDESLLSVGGLQASRAQLEELIAVPVRVGSRGEGFKKYQKELEEFLARAGLTMEEWAERIEQQTGIDVLDSKGRIDPKALEQAEEAIRLRIAEEEARVAAEEMARSMEAASDAMAQLRAVTLAQAAAWNAYIDQQNAMIAAVEPSLRDLQLQLSGRAGDPTAQFQNALASLGSGGSQGQMLQQLFGGFNLNDPAAREELKQLMLDYVNQMLAGTSGLEPEVLAGFVDFLGDATGILDGFTDSVDQATKSLLNMPTGINLAALEFQAQAAGTTGGSTAIPWTGETPVTRGGSTTTTRIEKIDIIVNGAGDPEAVAETVVRKLKRLSMARTGTPDNWSQG